MSGRKWTLLLAFAMVISGIATLVQPPMTSAQPTSQIELHKSYKTPIYIQEQWDKVTSRQQQAQLWSYLNERKAAFKITQDAKTYFAVKNQAVDRLKQTHYRVQQVHRGIKVWGADQTFHFKPSGELIYLGQFIPPNLLQSVSTQGKLSSQQAINALIKDLKLAKLLKRPQVELVIYPQKQQSNKNGFLLVYAIKISVTQPHPAYWHYFIDANSGKIVAKYNAIQHVEGKGKGVFNDQKSFEVRCEQRGTPCYLDDQKRKIQTYDAEKQDRNLPGKLIKSTSTTFNEPAGVDAHAYGEKTFDFYKKTFGRNSYDDKGANIISSVHVGDKWNNAAWNGEQMLYGDGDGEVFTILSGSLDVVAHELTHAVTEHTANLRYWGESGALNESFSDIIGVTVDNKNWLLGEDVYTPKKQGDALRSFSNPKEYKQPDHYDNRYIGFKDNGGVHINSGINNKAAYLIAAGGTHHSVTVKGIGRDKMAAIYYRAVNHYLTTSSDFAQMRKAAVQAATDLYGANSAEVTAVNKAYDAVGIK